MKYTKCLATLGLACLIAIALLFTYGCTSQDQHQIDTETRTYLLEMKAWHEEWDGLFWGSFCRPGDSSCDALFDDLIANLFSIDPPGNLYRQHNDYVNAHKLYVLGARHMHTMQQIEEECFSARGSDEIPDCEVVLYYDGQSVSTEYRQACSTEYWAFKNLCQVRAHWEFGYQGPFSLLEGE